MLHGVSIFELVFLFVTLAGYVVGLGAVTVIECHAWKGRHSSYWTEATTRTHKITKPLIWIGLAQTWIGSVVLYMDLGLIVYVAAQALIGLIVLANGAFLTHWVSPMLLKNEQAGHATDLLPDRWQHIVFWSFLLSWLGWWSSLLLFCWYLLSGL